MRLDRRVTRLMGMGVMTLALIACTRQTTPEPLVTAPVMSVLITETNCPSVEVQTGTQIIWTNKGSQMHVVQSEKFADGSRYFDSGELQPGDSFSFTFTEPKTLGYQCSLDGSMRGLIRVIS